MAGSVVGRDAGRGDPVPGVAERRGGAGGAECEGGVGVGGGEGEEGGGQLMGAAAAFEAAMAATVQPAVVAANRGLVQLLAATNFLGMNAPAIMDIEAAYEQMWALDVAA